MTRFRGIAIWYSNLGNLARLPFDTILAAIAIFAIVAPLFHLDPITIDPKPTLNAFWFAVCFSPVFGFISACFHVPRSREIS
jgi:hypothetical protein